MRLLWFTAVVASLYFALSDWALESHKCFFFPYLGPRSPEGEFWC